MSSGPKFHQSLLPCRQRGGIHVDILLLMQYFGGIKVRISENIASYAIISPRHTGGTFWANDVTPHQQTSARKYRRKCRLLTSGFSRPPFYLFCGVCPPPPLSTLFSLIRQCQKGTSLPHSLSIPPSRIASVRTKSKGFFSSSLSALSAELRGGKEGPAL